MDILEIFWENLDPASEEDSALLSESRLEEFYEQGLVDQKRCPKTRWQEIFTKFSRQENHFVIRREDLKKIRPFLYQGPIKRPFDPYRMADGLKPRSWLHEMYQKVLRFETALKIQEWNRLIETQMKERFFKGENFVLDQKSKDFIFDLLESKATPLRRLEVWVHQRKPKAKESPPLKNKKQPPASFPIPEKDRFEREPPEIRKMKAIEKLYYHSESPARAASDKDTLNILDELAEMEEDEGAQGKEPENNL